METESGQDLFPIGQVVAEAQVRYPDVSHSSLRFLEREGMITSVRTAGGHRLYSRAQIDRILQIKEWQRQRLTLEQIRERLADVDRMPQPEALSAEFLERAISGDLIGATQTILRADDAGVPMARIFGDVLTPALIELGSRWQHGQIRVAQEKEVSELVRDLIAELTLRHVRGEPHGPAIVAACVAGERHELGLRMVCGLLRAEGRTVYYLGADVEPTFLIEAVDLHRPAVVILSARLASALPALYDAFDAIGAWLEGRPPVTILVGGLAAVQHESELRDQGAIPITTAHPESILAAINAAIGAADRPETA